MPSIWTNFSHEFEVFKGLLFAFPFWRKDVLGKRLQKRYSDVFVINFEQISHIFVFSTVDFEQVNSR